MDATLTPTSTNGDINIDVSLIQPYWLNKWWAVWISYTAVGVPPVGSDFFLSESFQITSIPFSHTITVPAPGFSPANVCIMITTGNTQAEAENPAPLDTMAEDNRENCFTYPTDFPPATDPEVDNWADVRVPANGGTVSASTKSAANTFMLAIKAAGLRSKILRLNLFAGSGPSVIPANIAGACWVPLIKDVGGTIDTPKTTSTWFTYNETGAGGGLNTNGRGCHAETGFIASTGFSSDTDAGFSIYVTTNSAAESSWAMGAQDAVPNDWGLVGPDFTALGTRGDMWKAGTAFADAGGKGFYHIQKEGAVNATYKNTTLKASNSPGGVRVITRDIWIFALNLNGVESSATSRTLAGYGIYLTMDSTERTALYNAWQGFETTLSRQV